MQHHPECVFEWSGESETCNCTELYERDEFLKEMDRCDYCLGDGCPECEPEDDDE